MSNKNQKFNWQIWLLRALAVVLTLATLWFAGAAYWFAYGKWVWKGRNTFTNAQLNAAQQELQRCEQATGWMESEPIVER